MVRIKKTPVRNNGPLFLRRRRKSLFHRLIAILQLIRRQSAVRSLRCAIIESVLLGDNTVGNYLSIAHTPPLFTADSPNYSEILDNANFTPSPNTPPVSNPQNYFETPTPPSPFSSPSDRSSFH